SGLLIAHDEVLVINARQVKVQLPPVYCCLPHQTGVTKRSIRCRYWRSSDNVLEDMMVSHQAYRIGNRFAVVLDGEHHIIVANEIHFARACEGRIRDRTKHPLEVILSSKPGRAKQRNN